MVSLFPGQKTEATTPREPARRTDDPAPAPHQPPAARTAGGPLRCLWHDDGLTATVAVVDEFLRTPLVTGALADFYRARRGSRVPESEARALIAAVSATAARLLTGRGLG